MWYNSFQRHSWQDNDRGGQRGLDYHNQADLLPEKRRGLSLQANGLPVPRRCPFQGQAPPSQSSRLIPHVSRTQVQSEHMHDNFRG